MPPCLGFLLEYLSRDFSHEPCWDRTGTRCLNSDCPHAERLKGYSLFVPVSQLPSAPTSPPPFRNEMDRFHLVSDVIDRLPQLGSRAAYAKQAIRDKLIEHEQYITEHGDDMPEITGWKWGDQGTAGARSSSTEGDNV